MGCCVIFCAAEFDALARPLEKDDYILAADGGLKHTRKLGIEPNEIIGDFDSLGFTPPGAEVFPVEKDDTDTMFALKLGLEKGYRRFYIYGGLGGKRPDHTIANMQALLFLLSHGARGWLFGENYVWTAIKNSSLRIEGEGDVAVFCFDGKAEGVSIKGLKYELDDAEIGSDFPLGVSNSFASREAEISVKNGTLLIMYDIKVNEID